MSGWRKSSHSASGNCVEWRKSSHSMSNGHCTEVRDHGGSVQVRDSKDPAGPVLNFSPAEWREFTDRIKAWA